MGCNDSSQSVDRVRIEVAGGFPGVRLLFKLALPIVALVALAAGLLPPLLDQSGLNTDALNAARAASATLISSQSQSQADAQTVVQSALANDPGVELVSVSVDPKGAGTAVQVTLKERVHTYMSNWPGVHRWLKGWFELTSSETSSVGT